MRTFFFLIGRVFFLTGTHLMRLDGKRRQIKMLVVNADGIFNAKMLYGLNDEN